MKQQTKASIILTSIFLSVFILFQNCGDSKHSLGRSSNEDTFFHYSYTEKTAILMDFQLYSAAPTGSLNNFVIVGSAVAPDSTSGYLNYTFTIKNQQSQILCPRQSGTLPAGETFIQFSCTTAAQSSDLIIEMTIILDGKSQVLRKSF